MGAIPRQFRMVSDKTGHPLAFEPEALNVDEALAYNNMNWGRATPARRGRCRRRPGSRHCSLCRQCSFIARHAAGN